MDIRILEQLKDIKSLLLGKKVEDKWMDITMVAKYTSCSQSTIRRAIKLGRLSASKETGKILMKKSAIEKWLNNG